MIDVSAYPACAARLRFQRTNISEEGMTLFFAAVCVADGFSDETLAKFGGFNFEDRSDENGRKLLARLEAMIGKGRAQSTADETKEAEVSVTARLGAYGVKMSRLYTLEDYWLAATTLFGSDCIARQPKVRDIVTLHRLISAIPKKQRSKLARMNFKKLPSDWTSEKVAA